MARLRIVGCDSEGEWMQALAGTASYDYYHLPQYHALCRDLNQGEPFLFVFEGGGYLVALPLLLRGIEQSGRDGCGKGSLCDATSAYGYVGPVSSHTALPIELICEFQQLLAKALLELNVVSVFSRLHPLLDQTELLAGLGSLVEQGHTVSIDLSVPEDQQLAQYRENHCRGIRKLSSAGARVAIDEKFELMGCFIELYYSTMTRVGAGDEYLFPESYFHKLVGKSEGKVKLFVCSIQGDVAAAGIFLKCGSIMEYHLGGSSGSHLRLAPMKIVIDAARHWGFLQGAQILHLGGGVGSRDDSLAHFKKGFSSRSHRFLTWRWILVPSAYEDLVHKHQGKHEGAISMDPDGDFFPKYRS